MQRLSFQELKYRLIWGVGIVLAIVLLTAIANPQQARAETAKKKTPSIAAAAQTSATPWTGCYLGVNLGYAVQTSHAKDDQGPVTFDVATASDGFTYGGLGGCDLQIQRIVVGLMGSYDKVYTGDKINIPIGGGVVGDIGINSMYFLGGRTGFLATPKVLVYGLAGKTWVQSNLSLGASGEASDMGGLTLGGGIEAKADSGWSLVLEYRWVDLGNDTLQWGPNPASVAEVDNNLHQVRFGLTYHFGAILPIGK